MKVILPILLICVLLGVTPAHATAAPFEVDSPRQVATLLTSGGAPQRAQAARDLHLREPWEDGRLCVQYNAAELSHPALQVGRHTALLVAAASDCDFKFLVFFVEKNDRWIPAGTVPLSIKYGSPIYRVRSLIQPSESEIVISGQTVDAGTGVMQRNVTILKLVGDSMRVIFDQPESLHLSIPAAKKGSNAHTGEEQASIFFFIDDGSGIPGQKCIVESRVQHMGGQALTLRRKYVWDPDLSIFRMFAEGSPQ